MGEEKEIYQSMLACHLNTVIINEELYCKNTKHYTCQIKSQ